MSIKNLVIYKFSILYNIFKELSSDLKFHIIFAENENSLEDKIKNLSDYLVITNDKNLKITNKFFLGDTPTNLFKLVEQVNISFLKNQFHNQSRVGLNNYVLDLNSREISKENIKIKLTEKEISTVIYLSKKGKPADIHELQKKVWNYRSDIDTHTVETHIYRLRKKFSEKFNDDRFIISEKNGYQIKL